MAMEGRKVTQEYEESVSVLVNSQAYYMFKTGNTLTCLRRLC
jgi:hypothetical protein